MELDIFHLQAHSAFHFGLRGVGIEESADYAPSDTLFSALCNVLRLVDANEALKKLLDAFTSAAPPFLCSGGFPYVPLDQVYLRFYPAPATLMLTPEKELRKLTWVSESIFQDMLTGKLDTSVQKLKRNAALVTAKEFAAIQNLYKDFIPEDDPDDVVLWQINEVPRVAVDRLSSASNIFQAGRLRFVDGGGLWCGFSGLHDTFGYDRMKQLLTILGDHGLGGERSSGHGMFEVIDIDRQKDVKNTTIKFPDAANKPRFVTLSHVHPTEKQVNAGLLRNGVAPTAYRLLRRMGWMSSPDNGSLRHRAVRMIAAGSVLPTLADHPFVGEMTDVTPTVFRNTAGSHDVLRYGYALAIGMN